MEPMDKLSNILQEQQASQPAEANNHPSWDEVCKLVGSLFLDSQHSVNRATDMVRDLYTQIATLKGELIKRDKIIMGAEGINDGDGKGS